MRDAGATESPPSITAPNNRLTGFGRKRARASIRTKRFLHASTLRSAGLQSVAEGQRVEFNAVRSNDGKGDQAEDLRLA